MLELEIAAIGCAVPDHMVPQWRSLAYARDLSCATDRQRRAVAALYKRSGVESRYSVVSGDAARLQEAPFFAKPGNEQDFGPTTGRRMQRYKAEAVPLAHAAASSALRVSGVHEGEITHLITVSCTGFFAPGFDIELIRLLPLAEGVLRTQIGFMGCHGGMIALRTASDAIKAQPDAVVLISCVELCSLHYQYQWKADSLVANSLFADGSAAVVVRGSREIVRVAYNGSASVLIPDTFDAMTWDIADNGFSIGLSAAVPQLICRHLRPWLSQMLRKQFDLSIEDISHFAVHPGGPKILDAVQTALELSPSALDASRAVLAEYGNMSSPTVLFIVNELLSRRARGTCLVLGFGPGLTIEAALLEFR